MSSVTITIKGLDQGIKNAHLALANIKSGTEKGLDTVADQTLKQAKDDCPVGTPASTGIPGYKGGTLKKSLIKEKAVLARRLGSNVFYALFVHDGTKKMGARPFLTNAFHAKQKNLVPELQKMKVL